MEIALAHVHVCAQCLQRVPCESAEGRQRRDPKGGVVDELPLPIVRQRNAREQPDDPEKQKDHTDADYRPNTDADVNRSLSFRELALRLFDAHLRRRPARFRLDLLGHLLRFLDGLGRFGSDLGQRRFGCSIEILNGALILVAYTLILKEATLLQRRRDKGRLVLPRLLQGGVESSQETLAICNVLAGSAGGVLRQLRGDLTKHRAGLRNKLVMHAFWISQQDQLESLDAREAWLQLFRERLVAEPGSLDLLQFDLVERRYLSYEVCNLLSIRHRCPRRRCPKNGPRIRVLIRVLNGSI